MSDANALLPLKRILKRAYTASPERVVTWARQRLSPQTAAGPPASPPTEAFLRSDAYQQLMTRHLPWDGSYDRYEAHNWTKSFAFRHMEAQATLGAFRWRGMQENLDFVLDIVARPNALVVDFGGASGPLGLNTVVCDLTDEDAFGRPVPYRGLDKLPDGGVDAFVTSHTLEHIPDLDGVLSTLATKLAPGGPLVALLPSFSCERWRAGVHTSSRMHDHVWTFALAETELPPHLDAMCTRIDTRIAAVDGLDIEQARYVGDDSIWIVARKS